MDGPLEGIKVLELSRTLAGPFYSMQLADMGAEVKAFGYSSEDFKNFKNMGVI